MTILGGLFVLGICCLVWWMFARWCCNMNCLDLLCFSRNSIRFLLSPLIFAKPNQMHLQYANQSDLPHGLQRLIATSMQSCNKWDTNSSNGKPTAPRIRITKEAIAWELTLCRSFRNPIVLKDRFERLLLISSIYACSATCQSFVYTTPGMLDSLICTSLPLPHVRDSEALWRRHYVKLPQIDIF